MCVYAHALTFEMNEAGPITRSRWPSLDHTLTTRSRDPHDTSPWSYGRLCTQKLPALLRTAGHARISAVTGALGEPAVDAALDRAVATSYRARRLSPCEQHSHRPPFTLVMEYTNGECSASEPTVAPVGIDNRYTGELIDATALCTTKAPHQHTQAVVHRSSREGVRGLGRKLDRKLVAELRKKWGRGRGRVAVARTVSGPAGR